MAINKTIKSESPETEEFDAMAPEPVGCYKKRCWKIIAGIVIILVLVCALFYFNIIPASVLAQLHRNYQAVFLTNGQVYFGKLYRENSKYPTLREVYYLQVTQPPQPLQAGETPPANINLVKLGGELHSPQDEMRINRGQILFIEDLMPDSRVVQAIQQLQAPK